MDCDKCGAEWTEGHQCDAPSQNEKRPLQMGGGDTANPVPANPPSEPQDSEKQESFNGNIGAELVKQATRTESSEKEPNQPPVANSQVTNVYNYVGSPREGEEDKSKSNGTGNLLFELSEPLGLTQLQLPEDIEQHTKHFLEVVRKECLLVVSSPDPGASYFAGRRLVDRFEIPDSERRRELNLTRHRDECATMDIYSLFGKSDADKEGETAVIIRCKGAPAARFLDSLFDMQEPDFYGLREKLTTRGTYLICLIPSQELTRRNISARRLQFKVWHIDRLGMLLEGYYHNAYERVRDQLLDQQKDGLWPEDEQEFYGQVKAALEGEGLQARLEANQLEMEKKSAGWVIPEGEPLKQIAYYVATFFPDLNPSDFNKVVQVLLGNSTATVSKTMDQQAEDGTSRKITVEVEKPLNELWRKDSDTILKACNLIAARRESIVIAFSKKGMQGHFKKLLEENHCLYLENQFEMIQSTGLLFSPSAKVAENVISLIVDRILAYPDVYDKAWLFNLIRVVNATIEEISGLPWVSDIVRFLHAQKQYKRISELIRKLLDNLSLNKMVNGLLEELMSAHGFRSVFEIVKNLRYAANFDEFYWLKQLLERGDIEIAKSVLRYLSSEMRRLNYRVYEMLHALDGWRPDPNDTKKGNSISGRSPLDLLVEYYEYSMSEVTFENHGQWPTTYSLLFAKDSKTARDNFGLLIGWFFHPWMKAVLAERSGEEEPKIYYYTGSFVVGLSLLLLNSPDRDWDHSSTRSAHPPPDEAAHAAVAEGGGTGIKERRLRPDDLFEILLQELVKAAAQQKQHTVYAELAECWKDYKSLFVHLINQVGYKQPNIRGRLIGAYKTVLYLEAEFNRLRVETVSVSQRGGVN